MKKFLVILMVLAMTSFIFVGCLPTTNTGPVFTSTPGSTATVGTVYSYTPTATDADADTVTFSVAGPTGMAISAGVITWTPTVAQIGTETVVVTASDGTDATAQTFTITVSAVAPVVTAVTTLKDAAVVLDLATWVTADEITAFLDALANAAFTGYLTANDTAYVAAAVAGSFSAVSTVTLVNTAITTVNTAVTNAAAVALVNAATTSVLLNAALADTAFTGYLVANSTAYFTALATFTAATTVATVNAAILVVNTAQTAATALAAVNTAVNTVELNAALANAAFTGYAAINYNRYFTNIALFSATLTPTVATVDAAILVVNTAGALAAVVVYEALVINTDTLIVAAVADTAGARADAAAKVAVLPAGATQTAYLARIVAEDVLITAAATITAVTVAAVNIRAVALSSVTVTAVAQNAAAVTLTTGVTYLWTVTGAFDASTPTVNAADVSDLVFSSTTAKAPVISKALAADFGDSYTIKVVATKGAIPVNNTATTVTVN